MSESKPDEQFAQTLDGTTSSVDLPAPPSEPPPKLIAGRYRMGKVIGEGGFGLVYEAVDERLQKTVAIKLLVARRSRNNKEFERFQTEALATSRLSHPNIVSVTDFDVLPDGRPFLVMELVPGKSLDQVIAAEGKLPVARAASIARSCCLALEAAHAQGIVHRDLKPSNVVVRVGTSTSNTGETTEVKVLDFGVAKLVRGTRTPSGLTQTGQILGTPSYMAPEQVRDRGPVDGRADIYAVGVILYEMLAGTPPFAGLSLTNVLVAKVTDKPQRPSKHEPTIPPDIEDVIMKAIHPDRERRFKTAAAMAEALEPFQIPTLTLARRRRVSPWLLGALVVALIIAAVNGYFALRRRSTAEGGPLFPHAPPTDTTRTSGTAPATDTAPAPAIGTTDTAPAPAIGTTGTAPAIGTTGTTPATDTTGATPATGATVTDGVVKRPKRPPKPKPTDDLPDAPVERIRIR